MQCRRRGSDAISRAFREGDFGGPIDAKTVADSIAVGIPRNGYHALKQLRAYDGRCVTVSDDAILEAQHRLASSTGLFAEPAAATSLAGLLACRDELPEDARVVLLVTGNGLKDIDAAMRTVALPDRAIQTIDELPLPPMNTTMRCLEGIILAAGLSTRAGQYKMAMRLGDKTLIEHSVASMSPVVERVIVVGGHRIELLRQILAGYPQVEVVHNTAFREGMFSSVQAGLSQVRAERVFLLPGDCPVVSTATYRRLLEVPGEVVIPHVRRAQRTPGSALHPRGRRGPAPAWHVHTAGLHPEDRRSDRGCRRRRHSARCR